MEKNQTMGPKKLRKMFDLIALFNVLAELADGKVWMRRKPTQSFTLKEPTGNARLENGQPVVQVRGEPPHPIGKAHVDYDRHIAEQILKE